MRRGRGIRVVQPGEGTALGAWGGSLPIPTSRSAIRWSRALHGHAWGRMKGNRHKLKRVGFRLDRRKNFLTLREVKLQNRSPREAV